MRKRTVERYQKIYDLKIIRHYSITQIQEYFVKEQGVKLKQRVIYKAVEYISSTTVFTNASLRQNALDSYSYDANIIHENRQVLQNLFNKIASNPRLQENKKVCRLVSLANAIKDQTDCLMNIKDTLYTLQNYEIEDIESKQNDSRHIQIGLNYPAEYYEDPEKYAHIKEMIDKANGTHVLAPTR